MLIALIVVALVALVLLGLLVLSRSSAAEFRSQADGRESALIAERDKLTESASTLSAANDKLSNEIATARGEIDQLKAETRGNVAEIRRLEGEVESRDEAAAELQGRIDKQSSEIAALVVENNSLHDRAEAAEAARAAAEDEAVAAAARNTGVVVGEVATVEGSNPTSLWDLELVRSERTWRTSVAVDPTSGDGPFEGVDDPVRVAVEITAAALREDVGAFITLDWQVPPIEDPARRHLIVRVAQEMLEAAARTPEPLRLVGVGDEEIELRLEPSDADADAGLVKIPQPRLTDDLVVVNDAATVSVTVKD